MPIIIVKVGVASVLDHLHPFSVEILGTTLFITTHTGLTMCYVATYYGVNLLYTIFLVRTKHMRHSESLQLRILAVFNSWGNNLHHATPILNYCSLDSLHTLQYDMPIN